MKQYIYAATLPVQMDGPVAPATGVPITILASSIKDARKQARDAGLTLLGQINAEGKLLKKPHP
jgi:hypothetical protein